MGAEHVTDAATDDPEGMRMQVLELTDSHPTHQPTGQAVPCHDRPEHHPDRAGPTRDGIAVRADRGPGQFASTPTDKGPQTPKRLGVARVLPELAVASTCLAVPPHRPPHATSRTIPETMTDAPTAAHDAD